jgi:uncharacterized protein (TIGR00369 family)
MSENPEPISGIATLELISGMSGRQHLQAIIDGTLPAPPIARTMSFRIAEVGNGEVLFEALPGRGLHDLCGGAYAGWALTLTLIDTAAGCAAHSMLPAESGLESIESKVNFSRPIKAEAGMVWVKGRVIRKNDTIISAEGAIMDRQWRVVAHGTSTVKVLPG